MIKPFSPILVFDDWNDVQSKSIDLLRFPLAVAVVFFATHENQILRRLAIPLVSSIPPSVGQGWAFLRFFLTPAVCEAICLVFFYGACNPRTTNILTGIDGRLST